MQSEDWKISDSLDAFSDMLYGGYGEIQGGEHADLIWRDFEKSKKALGYNVTRDYYAQKLQPDSPFSRETFEEKLAALEQGTGQTYFDIILSIIGEHPNINLVAE